VSFAVAGRHTASATLQIASAIHRGDVRPPRLAQSRSLGETAIGGAARFGVRMASFFIVHP
jgi:hypothetical protein